MRKAPIGRHNVLLTVTLLVSIVAHGVALTSAGERDSVRVHFGSAADDPVIREFSVDPTQATVVDDLEFDLSISLEGAALEFRRAGTAHPGLAAQLQYETSVSIMDDGPHLDLLDWKHYTSEWLELETDTEGRFVLPVFTPDQQARFPEVTAVQLRTAVSEAGGDRWSKLLRDGGLGDSRVGVGISTIRVKFTDDSGPAEPLHYVIEFPVPMGC